MTKALSWLIKGSTLFCLLPWEPIAAQIVPDATLRVNSSVTIEGNNTSAITGGTQAGSNLFHSFEQFSVPTGSAVYFKNAPDIQNILTRVTGSSVSNIDGLIRANGIANVFLINPNGIIFGLNASLNIGGSFFGTTASNIKFADGISFDAKPLSGAEPLLTVSVPVGLGFGTNAGNIRVFGDGQGIRKTSNLIDTSSGLRVQPNQTLALVGGNILLSSGTLKTTGGQIELGSVAGAGLVNLIPTDKGWTLGYSGISANAFEGQGGNIRIDTKGLFLSPDSKITASSRFGLNGTIQINTLFTNPVQAKAEPEAIRATPEIASVCQRRSRTVASSKLVVTGTSGLPISSNDLPASNLSWQSNFVPGEAINNSQEPKSYSSEEPTQIIEAQALIQDSDGNFILTAKQPNTVVPNASLSASLCSQESHVLKVLPLKKTTQKDD